MAYTRFYGKVRMFSIPAGNKRITGILRRDTDGDILILPDGTYVRTEVRDMHSRPVRLKQADNRRLRKYYTGDTPLTGENRDIDLSSPARLFLAECISSHTEAIHDSIAYYDTPEGITCRAYKLTVQSADILSGTRIIDSTAFMNCTELTQIRLPDTLRIIGDHAFENCTKLGIVSLPDSLESIQECAFCHSGLTDITLGRSIRSIADYAFSRTKLSMLTVPKSVTYIGNGILSGCEELETVVIKNTRLKPDMDSICRDCPKLTAVM